MWPSQNIWTLQQGKRQKQSLLFFRRLHDSSRELESKYVASFRHSTAQWTKQTQPIFTQKFYLRANPTQFVPCLTWPNRQIKFIQVCRKFWSNQFCPWGPNPSWPIKLVQSCLVRGHSTTTWTKFWPFLTPSPPSSGQAWTFYIPPPLSTWTKGAKNAPSHKTFNVM